MLEGTEEQIIDLRKSLVDNWRQIAIGREGYLAYQDYVMRFKNMSAMASQLFQSEKELSRELGKAAGREKLFVPF